MSAGSSSIEKKFSCTICSTQFTHRSSFRRHRLKQHPGQSSTNLQQYTKKCGKCGDKFANIQKLCAHLKEDHNFDVNVQRFDFSNKTEFENWRKSVEHQGCFYFVSRGSKCYGKGSMYLFCHRSGYYRSRGANLRAPKSNVTNRIGYDCSAFAAVKFVGERVEVIACIDHYGHDQLIPRLRLLNNNKKKVSLMLEDNRSIDLISTVDFSSSDLESAAFDAQTNSPSLLHSTTNKRKLLQARLLKLAGSLHFLSDEEVAALGSKLVDVESKIACRSNQQKLPSSQQIKPNKNLTLQRHFSIKKNQIREQKPTFIDQLTHKCSY